LADDKKPMTNDQQPGAAHPRVDPAERRAARLAVATVSFGTFLATITGSAIRVAFPSIAEGLDASWAGIQWVSMVFLLTVTSLLATTGRLGDLYGLKRLYITGIVLFVTGSALCGAAWSLPALIVFRMLQACGSAMTASMGPALVATAALPGQRGRAMGWIGTAVAIGLSAGPPIGGFLLELGSWRWVFLINLPLGVLAVTGALLFLPRTAPAGPRPRFDLLGSLLLGSGFAALLLGLSHGRDWGWTSATLLGLIAAASVLIVVFLLWERRTAAPVLDLSLFSNRVFSSAVSSAMLLFMATIGVSFLVVFYLTHGLGLDGWRLGLVMAAQPLGSAASAPFAGRVSDRIGSLPLTVSGALIIVTAYGLLAWQCERGEIWAVALPLALIGLGHGIFGSPNSSALLGAAPRESLGIAGGVLATARTLGMASGVAIAGATFGSIFASGTGGLELSAYRPEHFGPLIEGMRTSLFVAMGIAITATVLAALRGRERAGIDAELATVEPVEPGTE